MDDERNDMSAPGSAPHLTDGEIDRFRRRTLLADELVAFADHLAACDTCRVRVAPPADLAAAAMRFASALGLAESHVPEDDVHRYVDGTLDAVRRGEIEQHLEQCATCADEVVNLQHFARQTPHDRRRGGAWWFSGLAAAAALLLGVLAWQRMRDVPPILMVLNDGAATIGVDASGNVDGVKGLPADDRSRLRQVLVAGRLMVPPAVVALAGVDSGTLRGPGDASGFRVIAPVATAVLSDRPALRWTRLSDNAIYVVRLHDEVTGSTVTSPPLRAGEWVPETPLARGDIYVWQVEGSADGRESTAPIPPAPAARFVILNAADAARMARAPASHLLRGVLYASVGLLDDAERELTELKRQNPTSDLVRRLVDQLGQAQPRTEPVDRP
jgi:anti-sigma factor RsiW